MYLLHFLPNRGNVRDSEVRAMNQIQVDIVNPELRVMFSLAVVT